LAYNPGNLSLGNFGGTSARRKLNLDSMLESIVTFKLFSFASDTANDDVSNPAPNGRCRRKVT
jgi:hypothetical protein